MLYKISAVGFREMVQYIGGEKDALRNAEHAYSDMHHWEAGQQGSKCEVQEWLWTDFWHYVQF